LGLDDLTSSKRQQLSGQGCTAFGDDADCFEQWAYLFDRRGLLGELQVAQDRREHVVEVVRDAPCETPDALELLGFDQPFLEQAALGDVLRAAHDVGHLAFVVASGEARYTEPANFAARSHDAML